MGYALESVRLDDRKAQLLTHYARSARDAASSVAAAAAAGAAAAGKHVDGAKGGPPLPSSKEGADAKDSGEPVGAAFNDADAKGGKRDDDWGAEWEDDMFTARSDVSALSSASWALFTPHLNALPARPRPGAPSNVPALAIARSSASHGAETVRSMYKDLVTVREFHSRLSSRTVRDDFEMGIDIGTSQGHP